MPAYGVSIDKDTRDALKTGLWLELKFSTTLTHNEMPFDSLLIEVDSEYSGFNIIRHHDNQYEGRCYYINLEKDMSSLYETIENIL